MGLVSGEKHISLSRVLIPRVTKNTNLYGTVTELKTNTADKKSRPFWGVISIVRLAFLPKLRRLRVCSPVIVIPLRLADPM